MVMSKSEQDGFSLIEVLVSIFVLSLGVIGAVGMQLAALRTAQQSAFQTAALQLASEMAEKIRTNTDQMKLDDQANPFLALNYRSEEGDPRTPSKLCDVEQCNAEELAQFDLYEWKQRIKESLPGGRAVICRDAAPWNAASDSLTWACRPGAGTNGTLVIKLGWRSNHADHGADTQASTSSAPSLAITVGPYLR